MNKLSAFCVVLVFLLVTQPSVACFILVMSDGNHVLVANHEDWFTNDAAIKINTPGKERYGSIIFTFESEGWAQGGMNEHGLFLMVLTLRFRQLILIIMKSTIQVTSGKPF